MYFCYLTLTRAYSCGHIYVGDWELKYLFQVGLCLAWYQGSLTTEGWEGTVASSHQGLLGLHTQECG